MAARISIKGPWRRKAHIGAVGVRGDGVLVTAWNGSSTDVCPTAHAEARLARKLDAGSVVYVARVRRDNEKLAMSKPCAHCERILKNRGISKVIYTISEHEYGVLEF